MRDVVASSSSIKLRDCVDAADGGVEVEADRVQIPLDGFKAGLVFLVDHLQRLSPGQHAFAGLIAAERVDLRKT